MEGFKKIVKFGNNYYALQETEYTSGQYIYPKVYKSSDKNTWTQVFTIGTGSGDYWYASDIAATSEAVWVSFQSDELIGYSLYTSSDGSQFSEYQGPSVGDHLYSMITINDILYLRFTYHYAWADYNGRSDDGGDSWETLDFGNDFALESYDYDSNLTCVASFSTFPVSVYYDTDQSKPCVGIYNGTDFRKIYIHEYSYDFIHAVEDCNGTVVVLVSNEPGTTVNPRIEYGNVTNASLTELTESEIGTENAIYYMAYDAVGGNLILPENACTISNTSGTDAMIIHYTSNFEDFTTKIVDTGVIESGPPPIG